jgi:1,4-alpha-glucan branching enzyme
LEAIDFLRDLNQGVYAAHRDVQTVAEESTSWPMVSRPTHVGGLGFGLKWDMGWMHDTLAYLAHDPIHRKYHHDRITFRLLYAFHENFLLPLSHDEVVHGKGSLLQRMPGDEWQQRANLRLLYGLQYLQPGKKLLFMGGEWNHDRPLDWHLLADERHAGIQRWIRDLNAAYRTLPALHELDVDPSGFEWVDCTDVDQSIVAWLRYGRDRTRPVLAACNLTPAPRSSYVLGVPQGGRWRERLNSDATPYGGSGDGNLGGVQADPEPAHGRSFHVRVRLPPLSVLVLEPELNA